MDGLSKMDKSSKGVEDDEEDTDPGGRCVAVRSVWLGGWSMGGVTHREIVYGDVPRRSAKKGPQVILLCKRGG
jgi:hypothetical protein